MDQIMLTNWCSQIITYFLQFLAVVVISMHKKSGEERWCKLRGMESQGWVRLYF